MSIETVYRVIKANGDLAGEYMDKKQADLHDQKLDCIYLIAELVGASPVSLDDAQAERVAEYLVDNKAQVLSALKKVKLDTVTHSEPHQQNRPTDIDDNVEPLKKAANS